MELVRDRDAATGLKARVDQIENKLELGRQRDMTDTNSEEWKWPGKWKRAMNKSTKKPALDKVLIFFLNIKGEIEPPRLIPLFSGNLVIWKNAAYDFDPRAVWTVKYKNKIIKALIIKEIDRRPVSNLDWDEVKKRGDATDSDEILVKMIKKAVIEKTKKPVSKGVIIMIVIGVIAAIVLFMVLGK